jgi:hypothetical protein
MHLPAQKINHIKGALPEIVRTEVVAQIAGYQ